MIVDGSMSDVDATARRMSRSCRMSEQEDASKHIVKDKKKAAASGPPPQLTAKEKTIGKPRKHQQHESAAQMTAGMSCTCRLLGEFQCLLAFRK